MVSVRLLAVAAAVCFWSSEATATIEDLPRTQSTIKIDGILDEDVWKEAVTLTLELETDPGENIAAAVVTRAFLVEDGENLFVAFEADDPEPESIRAYLRDRDTAWNDDYVGIILDTYNDERRAFEFYVNPLGVQMDKTLDDTANRNPWEIDDSWDAIWDSAGQITESGYVVEMRIPLSQLRFPDIDGVKTWGYDLRRSYPRDRAYQIERYPRDRNRSCYLCQVGKLQGLEGSRPSRDIEIVPTVTAVQAERSEEAGFAPMVREDAEIEAGLTVRWGITPDITANIAINPDFSQIEADATQLDVNERFALSYPEKRPFFLEGADYFNTPINAVFTRTVSSPDFGVKLTGKKDQHTFGFFGAQDAETTLLFPGIYGSEVDTLDQSNTAFVGRYNYGFENTSSLGGLITSREGDGYHNYVGGVDGRWRINDQHRVDFQYLQTDTLYPTETALEFDQPLEAFSGTGFRLGYDYETRNWVVKGRYLDSDEGFRLDSGLQNKVGSAYQAVSVRRTFYGSEGAWWTRIRASVDYSELNEASGVMAERGLHYRIGIAGPMQSWFSLTLMDSQERDDGILYDMNGAQLYLDFVPTGGLQIDIQANFGDQIDYANGRLGKRFRFQPNINWNISRNLLLRLRSVYSELNTLDDEPIFEAKLADTRLTWQFNLRSYLRMTVQYQDVKRNLDQYLEPEDARSKSVGRELLYSYKLNSQTVFFLGYTDNYVDNDSLESLTAEDRVIFMKIGYAWTP